MKRTFFLLAINLMLALGVFLLGIKNVQALHFPDTDSLPVDLQQTGPFPPALQGLQVEVSGPERASFVERASTNPDVLRIREVLNSEGCDVSFDHAVVKKVDVNNQVLMYATVPCLSSQGDNLYTLVYWSAKGCEGAMAVNKEGGYRIEGGDIRAFSVQDHLKQIPTILRAGESKLGKKVEGAVLSLSFEPHPLWRCPDCWDVFFAWCVGPCQAEYCYGYCCRDCDGTGYCAITGPCWREYFEGCCPSASR